MSERRSRIPKVRQGVRKGALLYSSNALTVRPLSTPPRDLSPAGVYDLCMRFAWGAIGWGIVIYAVLYLLWSGLVVYGFAAGYLSLAVRLLALALLTTVAARSFHFSNWRDLAPYTLSWAAIAILLDAVFLVPFSGWGLYAEWSVWVGYALVAILPILTSRKVPGMTRSG